MGSCEGQLVFSPATVLYNEEVSFADASLELTYG